MFEMSVGVKGFYKLVVSKDKECKEVVRETDWFPNLITNNGMDQLSGSILPGYISRTFYVGSSNQAPAFTDNALISQIASGSYTNYASRATDGQVATYTFSYQFAQGAAAGNVAEVGFGLPNQPLFSRALVLDGLGNPTTITVIANEFLTLTYEVRINIPQSDFTKTMDFTVDGSPVSTTVTMRANGTTSTSYWGAANTSGNLSYVGYGTMGGSTVFNYFGTAKGSNTTNTYTAGSYKYTFTLIAGINDSNDVNGINFVSWRPDNGLGTWKMNFTPALPKDNTKEATFVLGVSWVRA